MTAVGLIVFSSYLHESCISILYHVLRIRVYVLCSSLGLDCNLKFILETGAR